jgi:hypothetical protein
MTEHAELQQEIPAYVAGALDEVDRTRLEVHLAECLECQELVDCCEGIASGIRNEREPGAADHPDPLDLRAYGTGLRGDAGIARHIERCAACALEATVWKDWRPGVETGSTGRAARETRGWFGLRPFLAGAAVGVVATGMLVLVSRQGGGTPDGLSAWTGEAPLLLLEEAPRNDATAGAVQVAPDQPLIPLGVRVNLPTGVADGDRFRFSIQAPGGSPSWSQELSVGRIREEQSRAWVVGFLVPAKDHPPGRYVLRVAPSDNGPKPMMEVPFEVVR